MNWYKKNIYKLAMPRGVPLKWEPEQLERIRQMVIDGKSFEEIAIEMGVGQTSIIRLNNKYQWRPIGVSRPKNEFSESDIGVIKDLIEEGYSYKDIADLFGVSRQVIQKINIDRGWRSTEETGNRRIYLRKMQPYEERIINLYNQGLSAGDISKELNGTLSAKQVRDFLIFKGLKERTPLTEIQSDILEKGKQMVNLYLLPPRGQGMSLHSVANQFNLTSNVAKDYMKRTGLIKDEEFRSKEETDRGHSQRMLNWWSQFGTETGEKFKNKLLSYPTRQQAIALLFSLTSSLKGMDPGVANAVYYKYMQIINNHTFPDEIKQ